MADLITCADAAKYLDVDIADTAIKAKIDALISQASATVERYCSRTFALTEYKAWVDGQGGSALALPQYPITRLYQVSCGTQDFVRLSYTGSAPEAFASCDGATLTLADSSTADITLASYATGTLLKAQIETNTGWGCDIFSGMDSFDSTKIRPFSEYCKGSGNEIDIVIPDESQSAVISNTDGWLIEGSFPSGTRNVFVWYKAGYSATPAGLKAIVTSMVADAYRASERDTSLKSEKLGDYSYTAGSAADGVDMQNIIKNYEYGLSMYRRMEFA